MGSSEGRCVTFSVIISTLFTFLCNIGLTALSAYSIAGFVNLWKCLNETELHDDSSFEHFVRRRFHKFDREDHELLIWSCISCGVYAICVLLTIGYVLSQKKNTLFWAVAYIFSSFAAIILTASVITLYILSYLGLFKNEIMSEHITTTEDKMEVGVSSGAAIFYVIVYVILMIYVWKKSFNFPNDKSSDDLKLDYINGGGYVEEIGSPDDIQGYTMYNGNNPGSDKLDGKPTRRHRKVAPNMYSESESEKRRSAREEYINQRPGSSQRYQPDQYHLDSDPMYSNVSRRERPDPSIKSSYRPNSSLKLGTDQYSVEPYYHSDDYEERRKRYAEQELIPDTSPQAGSMDAYANLAYENEENFYQIPRAALRKP